jgi:hypothetical protein
VFKNDVGHFFFLFFKLQTSIKNYKKLKLFC